MVTSIRLALLVAVPVILLRTAASQERRRPQTQTERVSAAGTVEGFQVGVLQVVSEAGDQYLVKVPERPQAIKFISSAAAGWLQPGMFIEFSGEFNKKGQAQAPISELKVFTPGPESQIGVFPEPNVSGESDGALPEQTAQKKTPESQIGSFRVAGKLASLRAGKMIVAAGRASVKADLSESAQVSVEISDLRFMRKGDQVTFEGQALPNQKQRVAATELTVTAAQPLGQPLGSAGGTPSTGATEKPDPGQKPENPE